MEPNFDTSATQGDYSSHGSQSLKTHDNTSGGSDWIIASSRQFEYLYAIEGLVPQNGSGSSSLEG